MTILSVLTNGSVTEKKSEILYTDSAEREHPITIPTAALEQIVPNVLLIS